LYAQRRLGNSETLSGAPKVQFFGGRNEIP
jgi:hypothetical protein